MVNFTESGALARPPHQGEFIPMKRMFRAAVLSVALAWQAFVSVAVAETLPYAKPEEVGFSSERLGRVTDMLRTNIAAGEIPGAVLLIARHGKIAYFESLGLLDPQAKTPMQKDAIFRIYSMTKPITTVTAMMLFEDAKLALNKPVEKYIPSMAKMQVATDNKPDPEADPHKLALAPADRPISIQDLMRHTSGLTYGFFGDTPVKKLYAEADVGNWTGSNAEFVERIAKLPLSYQPGTTWDYSHSTDVLGRIIEVISGKSLYEFAKERILDPLRMTDTRFYVTEKAQQSRIAEPFENDRKLGNGIIMGDPRVGGEWESGGGGLVSTATDYARFLQMLLNGGTLDGQRILGPKTVAYMTSDHLGSAVVPGPYFLPGPGYGFGLGFAVRRDAGVAPVIGSPGEYNWGGVGGTVFWVDPKEEMLVAFMMQSPSQRMRYRPLLRDMIYSAIDDEAHPADGHEGR
jgi:CubicO group peptidase (beta-lactamase class C family)